MTSKLKRSSFPILLVLRSTHTIFSLCFIILIANNFGASAHADLFFIAQIFPVIGGYQVKDALNLSLISTYSQVRVKAGADQADHLATLCFFFVLVAVVCLTLLYDLTAPELFYHFSSFSDTPLRLYIKLIVFLSPVMLLLSLVGVLEGILYSYGRFVLTAVANLCFYGFGIGSILLFANSFHILAPVIGLTFGCFAQLLIILFGASKHFRLRMLLTPWHSFGALDAFKPLLSRLLPVLYISSILQVVVITQRLLAFYLGEGNVSLISYATRLTFFLPFIMYSAFIVPSLSSLAVHVALEDKAAFRNHIKETLRTIIVFALPVLVWLLLYRECLIRFFLERGMFSVTDTHNLSILLLFSLPAILPVMFIHVYRQSLLTMNKMKQLTTAASVSVGIGILSSLILIFSLGLKGIVLGGTIGIFFNFLFFNRLLSRYSGRILDAEDGIFLLKIFLISGIALILSYAFGLFVPLLSAEAGISVLLNFLVYMLIYVVVAMKSGTIGLFSILSSLDRLRQSIAK